MNAVHNVPYAKSGSNYGANLVISLGSSSIVGLVGVMAHAAGGGDFAWAVFTVFVALGAACLALLRFPLPDWPLLRGKPARAAAAFNEGWHEIQRTPRTSLQVVTIDVVKYLLTAWRFQLAFGLLGVDESFWFFLVVAPAAAIAGIIAFTPGALGFRELFVTTAAVAMGSTLDDGLLAATTDRGVMLASAVVLGVAGYAYTVPRLRRANTTHPTPS
jgi:MFS family permease